MIVPLRYIPPLPRDIAQSTVLTAQRQCVAMTALHANITILIVYDSAAISWRTGTLQTKVMHQTQQPLLTYLSAMRLATHRTVVTQK